MNRHYKNERDKTSRERTTPTHSWRFPKPQRNSTPGSTRICTGQAIAELALACLLAIPICILGSCLVVVLMAISINDSACRDAARAAAQASDSATSLALAQTSIVAHQSSGVMYGPVSLDAAKFIYQDFAGNPPANVSPYVQVTTKIPCVIPAPIPMISGAIGMPNAVTFNRTYRFPIVKLKLYLPSN